MRSQKILFLTLNTFSLTGGIEKVCRVFSKALHDLTVENALNSNHLRVMSLCDQPRDVDENYCLKQNFKGYGYNRVLFCVGAIATGLKSQTIILSHINLLPIAFMIKLLSPKSRIVLFAHGIEVWRELKSWKRRFLQRNVEIWAVSEYTQNVLRSKHNIKIEKIKVLNNCLDPYFKPPAIFEKPAQLLTHYKLTSTQPVIVTISRLSSSELYKGYDSVIEVLPSLLSEYPDLTYILAGKADEAEKQRLEKLIASKGLQKHILLPGFIPAKKLVDLFMLADVFIMPSKKEGFGIVFIEAAACGSPVVAGNQDGSRDALLNGELGLLVNPDSSEELVRAIKQSISEPRNPAASAAQQKKCLAHFSYDRYKEKIVKLLDV